MSALGTQEAKRTRKAAPPALERPLSVSVGCLGSLVLVFAACVALFAQTRSSGALIAGVVTALVLGGVVARYLHGLILLALVRFRWTNRGIRCLVVYSDSPIWFDHIQTQWLSRIGDRARVVNWSRRGSWKPDLAVRVFRRFCGEWRNYNPAVVVFRGLRRPYVFRYYYAFQQMKAGRRQYLEALEARMFEALRLDDAA